MIEVYETKKIPENCSTCLYGGGFGCGNSNRQKDWFRYMWLGYLEPYADNHPEAGKNGMIRGGYGQGKGNQSTWGYYGSPGTNGVVRKETDKGTLVTTHGNPANMPMYEAAKQLKERLSELVKEVFNR